MDRKVTFVFTAAVALLLSGAARAANFSFGFDGMPERLSGAPGEVKTFDVFATLTTTNNPEAKGAQGWSISVGIQGGVIRAATSKGVTLNTLYDDDALPGTPPLNEVFDLANAGFKPFGQATGDYPGAPADIQGQKGIFSAIVLTALGEATERVLVPQGTEKIFKLTIEATIPTGDTEAPLTVRFANGFKGPGVPTNNVVTFNGSSVTVAEGLTLGRATALLTPPRPEFNLAIVKAGSAVPASGDSVIDIEVDADRVSSHELEVVLVSKGLPEPKGPQGWSLSIGHSPCMSLASGTAKGVLVTTLFDDDALPGTPSILDVLDLRNAGFKPEGLATGDYPGAPAALAGYKGYFAAIVLTALGESTERVLRANSSDVIFKAVANLPAVGAGQSAECVLQVIDGMKGPGVPTNNVITYQGASVTGARVTKQGIRIKVTGKIAPQKDGFIRGDANDDGKVNIADVVWIVWDVVPSLGGPPTLCVDAGDANNDNRLDLIDAVYIIDWQFRGSGRPPLAPFTTCGTELDSTDVTCPADSTGCPSA